MPTGFDIENCKVEAFCVAYIADGQEQHVSVPLERDAQKLVLEVLIQTYAALSEEKGAADWHEFDVSENPRGVRALRAATTDEMFAKVKHVYDMSGRKVSIEDFRSRSAELAYYYAIFRDKHGHKLIGFKQAKRIKANLKSRYLIVAEALRVVDEKVFRLDPTFDFLVGKTTILALSAHVLEVIAEVERFVAEKYRDRTRALARAVPDIDWGPIQHYADSHRRAQRLLIALSRRKDLKKLNAKAFKGLLSANKCPFVTHNGVLGPEPRHEMAFLEILEGRRYPHDITGDGDAILYRATNRAEVKI